MIWILCSQLMKESQTANILVINIFHLEDHLDKVNNSMYYRKKHAVAGVKGHNIQQEISWKSSSLTKCRKSCVQFSLSKEILWSCTDQGLQVKATVYDPAMLGGYAGRHPDLKQYVQNHLIWEHKTLYDVLVLILSLILFKYLNWQWYKIRPSHIS